MKEWIFRQKYRFDIGGSYLTLLNFALLVISAGDKLTTKYPSIDTRGWLFILVPVAFIGVWFMGWVLDKMGAIEYWNREANKRNEMLKEIHSKHE